MRTRHYAALLLGSALITLDGTAATVALPAIGKDLELPFSHLQWISNASLLMLAALLMPCGALVDRRGWAAPMRAGLVIFVVASALCALATSGVMLIASRLLQGAGAALVLPSAVAQLRAAFTDEAERTRRFGTWAAWTGVASAVGPLLGGAFVDVLSWRAVFALSSGTALIALVLLGRVTAEASTKQRPLPIFGTAGLIVFLGSVAYLLIDGNAAGWRSPQVLAAAALLPVSLYLFARSSRRQLLVPGELFATSNCVAANGATFALYFGLFGLSFLVVLYTQQALGYSGLRAGLTVLPISLMLFFAEPFGRLAARVGTRLPIAAGSVMAGAGILWMASGTHPLPFWSHLVPGTTMFGLGVSLSVSPLTHAAVSAVPEGCAGAASAFNHAIVRAAGLLSIALLGSIAADERQLSVDGFMHALWVCGSLVAAAGVVFALRIRNEAPGGLSAAD
ncbi:MAG TPA: MFS transporter [Vicinamibacterales bacterium]